MKRRFPAFVLGCFIATVFAAGNGTAADRAAAQIRTRIALVPGKPELRGVSDLLSVTLSRNPGIDLLERSEMERILQEHALSQTETSPTAEIHLGKLLGADGLIYWDLISQGSTTQLTARVIAVRPGAVIRAMTYPWPVPDLGEWPSVVRKQLEPFLPKLTVAARDAIPVSIVNLRSASKSPTSEALELQLTTLFTHRLALEPEVFVLERQRLNLLTSEKELAHSENSPFWSGSYLVDGVIDRDGYSPERVTVSLRITPPKATPVDLEIAGPRSDLAQPVDALARKLISQLGRSPATADWTPAKEAARFTEEGRWALRWKAFPQAQAAAETAWALGDRSLDAARLRVLAYCEPWPGPIDAVVINEGSLQYSYSRVIPEALDPIAQSLENFVTISPLLAPDPSVLPGAFTNDWPEVGVEALQFAAHHLSRYAWTPAAQPAAADSLARLRNAARRTQDLILNGAVAPGPADYATPRGRKVWQTKLIPGWLWERSPAAVLDEYQRLIEVGMTPQQRHEFIFRDVRRPALPVWTPQDRAISHELWSRFLDRLQKSTNSSVALMGHLLRLQYTPTGQLRPGPNGTYEASVQPLFDQLLRMGTATPHVDPDLFLDAIKVSERKQSVIVDADNEPQPPDASQRFRTNFVYQWADRGQCTNIEILARLFRPAEFESAHLADLIERVRERDAASTNVSSNKVLGFKKAFFRASLKSCYESISSNMSRILKGQYRREVFERLLAPEDYSSEETETVLNEIRMFRGAMGLGPDVLASQEAALEARIAQLRSERTAPGQFPPKTPRDFPQGVLEVTRWQALPVPKNRALRVEPRVIAARYDDGSLWIEARWVQRVATAFGESNQMQCSLIEFPLAHEGQRAIPFTSTLSPDAMGWRMDWPRLSRSFELLGDRLYLNTGTNVLTSLRTRIAWTPLSVPFAGSATLRGLLGRLYLRNDDSVSEYDPATQSTRLLASTRRRPTQFELDGQLSYRGADFFPGDPAGPKIHFLLEGQLHTWDQRRAIWDAPETNTPQSGFALSTVLEDGALLRTGPVGIGSRQIIRLAAGQPKEILFESTTSFPTGPGRGLGIGPMRSRQRDNSRLPAPSGRGPRWKTPPNLDATQLPIFAETGRVAVMATTILAPISAPIDLYIFEDTDANPVKLRLTFRRSQPFPSESPNLQQMHQAFLTPEGLIITRNLWTGFWFVPREELDRAITQARHATNP